jgi:hypothetical protein
VRGTASSDYPNGGRRPASSLWLTGVTIESYTRIIARRAVASRRRDGHDGAVQVVMFAWG